MFSFLFKKSRFHFLFMGFACVWTSSMSAQTQPAAAVSLAADPGVRAGAPAAGTAISGLSPAQMSQFQAAQNTFAEVDSVSGTMPGEPGTGLGPSFNMNSCAGCHAFPAIGGSSPKQNPQIAVATMYGAQNKIPSFLSLDGPRSEEHTSELQ